MKGMMEVYAIIWLAMCLCNAIFNANLQRLEDIAALRKNRNRNFFLNSIILHRKDGRLADIFKFFYGLRVVSDNFFLNHSLLGSGSY